MKRICRGLLGTEVGYETEEDADKCLEDANGARGADHLLLLSLKMIIATLSTANAKATESLFEGSACVSEVGSGDCVVAATAKRDRRGPISVSPQGGSH